MFDLQRLGHNDIFERFSKLTLDELFFFNKNDLMTKKQRWDVICDYLIDLKLLDEKIDISVTSKFLKSEEDFFKIKAYLPVYSSPQTNNKNRSWSDICDEATAVWDSLDTSNQSNIECARAWFLEGYHQALTRGQE